jgi:serine/threonine-protein kinase RsbW
MAGNEMILVDGSHPLFNKEGMFFKEFASDIRQVRFYSMLVVQKAPPEIREINLLEQQVSELIKNGVRHGNKRDPGKKIRIWASFSRNHAHIIVEDEGEGFKELDQWNEFNRKRNECFRQNDYGELENYFAYRTSESDDNDGGNALFAALEYWDGGVVFNDTKNGVAVHRHFHRQSRPGIALEHGDI